MNKWKKIVCLIAAVIVFIIVQLWFKEIEQMAEEENYPYELARKEKAYFEELTEYCREHEDLYMEISEQVFDYLDEGLSINEACTAMKNNATLEQKEILEQTTLGYPDKGETELLDNGLYYTYMRACIYALYIHEYSEEMEKYITSMEFTKTVKINDHLYVCYTDIPYT